MPLPAPSALRRQGSGGSSEQAPRSGRTRAARPHTHGSTHTDTPVATRARARPVAGCAQLRTPYSRARPRPPNTYTYTMSTALQETLPAFRGVSRHRTKISARPRRELPPFIAPPPVSSAPTRQRPTSIMPYIDLHTHAGGRRRPAAARPVPLLVLLPRPDYRRGCTRAGTGPCARALPKPDVCAARLRPHRPLRACASPTAPHQRTTGAEDCRVGGACAKRARVCVRPRRLHFHRRRLHRRRRAHAGARCSERHLDAAASVRGGRRRRLADLLSDLARLGQRDLLHVDAVVDDAPGRAQVGAPHAALAI